MRPIEEQLAVRFEQAIGLAFGVENAIDPLIKRGDPKFADYQANVAMSLAKRVAKKPREVAAEIVKHLKISDIADPPTIAGPGFINLKLKREFLETGLRSLFAETKSEYRAGADRVAHPKTVVVDYSGPNVAKQMHVGHLRSTILGDTIARVLEFLGHRVVRQNHIGDFGTQFGMLIHYMRVQNLVHQPLTIEDLDRYYKAATEQFKKDPAFAVDARRTVVDLQTGEPAAVELWNRMRVETHRHYTEVYAALGVGLSDADERGESFYKDRLAPLVERLQSTLPVGGEESYVGLDPTLGASHEAPVDETGMSPADAAEMEAAVNSRNAGERVDEAREPWKVVKPFCTTSGGAVCVFMPGYVGKDKNPLPLMVQKSDGGYPYSATDLAALYFRVQEEKPTDNERKPLRENWHADRVIYLVDERQSQHFAMVFDAFRAAQWDVHPGTRDTVSMEHAAFGKMLGQDGRPFKTRSGDTVKLRDLMTEAITLAERVVSEKNPDMPSDRRPSVARAVGIAAIKYADLRQDRLTDYIFNLEQMIAPEGNTGPYLQYAYARIQSIFRRVGADRAALDPNALQLAEPSERELAKTLLGFPQAVESLARDLKPHYLCQFLYDLAGAFSTFYDQCSVKDAATPEIRASRLILVDLVAQTLKLGLETLLGIAAPTEM